jgi:hypothetical protein
VTHTPIDCNDNSECTYDSCCPDFGCSYTYVDCEDYNACTVMLVPRMSAILIQVAFIIPFHAMMVMLVPLKSVTLKLVV